MINILHAIDTGGPGGAETVFINLVTGLEKHNCRSHAVIPRKGWVHEQLNDRGVVPIIVKSKGGFSFKYLYHLIRIIKSKKIDIVLSHLFGSNVYCSLAGLICRVPVISVFHGFVDTSENESLVDFKFRLINWGSKHIVFVSDQLKAHYQQHTIVSRKKSITIYNGIDTDVFKPAKADNVRKELGFTNDNIVFGSIGNIRPAKGYDILIVAATQVIKEFPQCRFIIAGQGSGKLYESLLKKIKDLNLRDYLTFIGFRGNVANVLNNFDAFVLPSTTEGFSISTIEAMACGIPIVVTKSGGPEEIVDSGINGIMVNANSVESLVIGLREIVTQYDKAKGRAVTAIDDVNTKFNIQSMIMKYLSLLLTNK
ncbi:glycosyltransferase family 4 protein [Desulfosarcina ovata]|uniref:Glycosyl transferase n=1 Tax=Desulfosarcina ovata subsp. ovata TaxID=2752305 RepID=A0A5K8A849_9BACT|nr:glycosyltransferase family 4 protein [Desulfosarcina ovata]BBO88534.1 glycosyl transferase [Desulfosarcina ovata subsp. ovata]